MNRASLEARLSSLPSTPPGLFSKASLLGLYILEHGSSHGWLSQHIIKLHAAILDQSEDDLVPISGGLLREIGLFPYIANEELAWKDRVAVEAFRAPQELGVVFHREQEHAFQRLSIGNNVVLSAPTSFGKTLLIDAVIASRLPDVVVLVVPTLALLDEQRRRLLGRFSDRYQIITRADQNVDPTSRTIFILTQERLLEREDIDQIDLFIIDEFYKLNGDPADSRSKALNIAFQKYRRRSKQIFLLGPNIKTSIPTGALDCDVIDSSSVTVATEVHDHRGNKSKRKTLLNLLGEATEQKSLVFCKSPASARKLAQKLIEDGFSSTSRDGELFSDWLCENYHSEWIIATALKKGIGIHHGAVPRSIGQRMLRLFDEADLNLLICTSTLIEGVNTKAENIFIYDKKIENRNFDFFSYQNIKGRAGRFGSYLIGHVHLFEDPPEEEQYTLEIPSLTDSQEVSDEFVIGFEGFDRNDEFRERRNRLVGSIKLPARLIAQLATFQIDDIKKAAEIVEAEVVKRNPRIFWTGRTEYQHLAATLNLTWPLFAKKSPIFSGNQAAFYASRLLQSRGIIKEFLARLTEGKSGEELQIELEKAFRAIRSIEFSVPDVLRATELLVNHFCDKHDMPSVEYLTMARMVESYFLPSNVKALEEIGIPTPIGVKLVSLIGEQDSSDAAMRVVRSLRAEQLLRASLTPYEQELLRSAL